MSQEEKMFKNVVKSNPASLDRCFLENIFKPFPKKSMENLVSYYFNVFLLQRREYHNRQTRDNIDSNDDESDLLQVKVAFCIYTLNQLYKKRLRSRGLNMHLVLTSIQLFCF